MTGPAAVRRTGGPLSRLAAAALGAFAAAWIWPRTGSPGTVLLCSVAVALLASEVLRRVLPSAAGPLGAAAVLIGLAAWSPALAGTPVANGGSGPLVAATLLAGTAVATLSWWRARHRMSRVVAAALVVVALLTAGWVLAAPRLQHRTADVAWRNGDVALAGRLHLPLAGGPHPLVVLLGGSGPTTRDHARAQADTFARRGLAVLSYDERGTGSSRGGSPYASFDVLAADAVAGITAVSRRADVDGDRVGIWGHSEGAWIAVAAATRDDRVDWLVLVSGGGVSPGENIRYQQSLALAGAGLGRDDIDAVWRLRRTVNDYYRTGGDRAGVEAALRRAQAANWWARATGIAALPTIDEVPRAGSPEADEWLAMWDFPSVDLLAELDLPVLSVHGGLDRQDPAARAAAAMRALVAERDDGVSGVLIHPAAGHDIEERAFGQAWLPPSYAAGYQDRVADWIAARALG